MSAYGMCFVLCIYMNHLNAQHNNFSGLIHYAMDEGNVCASHIEGARHGIIGLQNAGSFFHMGEVTFHDDERMYALQVADVVAWAALREAMGRPFDKELEPLASIFDEYHIAVDPRNLVPRLADQLEESCSTARRST
jgi:hypothetical protein